MSSVAEGIRNKESAQSSDLEKTAAENYKVFKRTVHDNIMITMQTTEWYLVCKSGQTSV